MFTHRGKDETKKLENIYGDATTRQYYENFQQIPQLSHFMPTNKKIAKNKESIVLYITHMCHNTVYKNFLEV
jgi:hypothetical protein